VPGWIRLGDDDRLYFEFIDVQRDKNKVIKRQLSIDGEKMTEQPFRAIDSWKNDQPLRSAAGSH
jgi:hypothetical protein